MSLSLDALSLEEKTGDSTALHESQHDSLCNAAKKGDTETITRILNGGNVDVNAANDHGSTPLFIACENGHDGVVRLLLEAGAEDGLAERDGWTPLLIACHNGRDRIVGLLLSQPSLDAERVRSVVNDNYFRVRWGDEFGTTLLSAACEGGHSEVVKVLLEKGARVRAGEGEHPMMVACAKGNADIVKLLLQKEEVDVNLESEGETLLYTACARGHEEVVKLLLDRGADVNIGSESIGSYELGDGSFSYYEEKTTPLYVACENGYDKVVKLLLEAGAEVNRGKEKLESAELPVGEGLTYTTTETPLEEAEIKEFDKIVKLLEKHAKDPTAKTDKQKRADAAASATERYKKELTSVNAVRALSDEEAKDALTAMTVKGRGAKGMCKKRRHALLIDHLGLTE